jgi:hypothetical protein
LYLSFEGKHFKPNVSLFSNLICTIKIKNQSIPKKKNSMISVEASVVLIL